MVLLFGLGSAGLSFVSFPFDWKTDHKPLVGETGSDVYYHWDWGRSGTLTTEDPVAGRIVKTGQASFLGMLGQGANTPCSVTDLIDPRFPS